MWLRPQGYAMVVSPQAGEMKLGKFQCEQLTAGTNEYDSVTCFHCNTVTHIKAKMDPADMGGLCKVCMKMICPECVGNGCKPFEKRIEEIEKRDYLRRQNAMVMGS